MYRDNSLTAFRISGRDHLIICNNFPTPDQYLNNSFAGIQSYGSAFTKASPGVAEVFGAGPFGKLNSSNSAASLAGSI
jgi:hypothetical protein